MVVYCASHRDIITKMICVFAGVGLWGLLGRGYTVIHVHFLL